MTCLFKRASRMDSSKYLHRVFTYWLLVVVVALLSFERAGCTSLRRIESGDRFTNPFYSNGYDKCANISARCVDDLLNKCSECVCNKGTETYRADIQRCVSTEKLSNFSGCRYKGIKDVSKELLDDTLPTLDFTKSNSKNIYGLLEISQSEDIRKITCEINNSTSFLDGQGVWKVFSDISDELHIYVSNNYHSKGVIERYLTLQWEDVKNVYSGLLIKLQILCRTRTDPDAPERGCFLFKTKGESRLDIATTLRPTIKEGNETLSKTTKLKDQSPTIFATEKTAQTSTEKKGMNKSDTYSVSMPVIIGVSAGVGLVILIIIILAICYVRYRTRKHQKEKPSIVSTEAPKVHFTAQARFSLIQEAAPLDPDNEDYTSLKEDRESYDPYCSLRKDDVDLNVIDTILKGAVSMESMRPSLQPRYSCRLTNDNAIVIESAKPHSPRQPKYHVLEAPDDVDEPDYEEVDSSDDEYATTSSRLSDTKPPLPEREYHELERPDTLQSEC